MIRTKMAALALGLAGCAAQPAAVEHGAAVDACAAAVAAHVGKPVEAVAPSWTGTTAEGRDVVTVTDDQGAGGERRHTCEVDAAGQVLAIRHPGA